jgi:hypothetical protein
MAILALISNLPKKSMRSPLIAVVRAAVPAIRPAQPLAASPGWQARRAIRSGTMARTGSSLAPIRSSTSSAAGAPAVPVSPVWVARPPRPAARRDSDTDKPVAGSSTRSGRRSTTSPSVHRDTHGATHRRATSPSRARESARYGRATGNRHDQPTMAERMPAFLRLRLSALSAHVPIASFDTLRSFRTRCRGYAPDHCRCLESTACRSCRYIVQRA